MSHENTLSEVSQSQKGRYRMAPHMSAWNSQIHRDGNRLDITGVGGGD
jgi:hypothetical protein